MWFDTQVGLVQSGVCTSNISVSDDPALDCYSPYWWRFVPALREEITTYCYWLVLKIVRVSLVSIGSDCCSLTRESLSRGLIKKQQDLCLSFMRVSLHWSQCEPERERFVEYLWVNVRTCIAKNQFASAVVKNGSKALFTLTRVESDVPFLKTVLLASDVAHVNSTFPFDRVLNRIRPRYTTTLRMAMRTCSRCNEGNL